MLRLIQYPFQIRIIPFISFTCISKWTVSLDFILTHPGKNGRAAPPPPGHYPSYSVELQWTPSDSNDCWLQLHLVAGIRGAQISITGLVLSASSRNIKSLAVLDIDGALLIEWLTSRGGKRFRPAAYPDIALRHRPARRETNLLA